MEDLSPELVERLRKDPVLFCEKVLDVEPYPYQKKILNNGHDRVAWAGGRQTGKTTMMAWMAIHEFTMYSNRKIIITSRSMRQALNFMEKLKSEIITWIKNEDKYGLDYVSKSRIEGKNGSWIEALPPVDETIRGFTADSIFVDEASFLPKKLFTSILSPMLATTDGQFVLASTAWGKEGYFYDKARPDDDADDYWESWQISSIENPEIPARQIDEWRRDMTEMEFDREVLARFSDKQNAFFKSKDIQSCLEWSADLNDGDNIVYPDQDGRECFMGVDPATTGEDKAVLTSIDTQGNVFDVTVVEKCEIPELENEIRNTLNLDSRNYLDVLIEENGLGEGTVHRFEREFNNVNGFRTTIRTKESIYNQTKNMMQKKELQLPDRDDLLSQVRTVEYENTDRGNMKIFAPGEQHDDVSDSLCLAVAANTGRVTVERQEQIYTAGSSSQSDSERYEDVGYYST